MMIVSEFVVLQVTINPVEIIDFKEVVQKKLSSLSTMRRPAISTSIVRSIGLNPSCCEAAVVW